MRRTRTPDRSSLLRVLPLLTLIAVASACGENGDDLTGVLEPSSSPLTGLEVTPAEAFLQPGEERQFSVDARDADGEPAAVEVDWTATGGTVDDDGLFTAGSDAGDFVVTATHSSGLEAEAAVTIEEAASASGSGDDGSDPARECESPRSEWIWCDDFEVDRLDAYFDHNDDDGDFVPLAGVGVEGSAGMRARFQAGEVNAGWLHLAFGRTPQSTFDPVDQGTADYREIYWRVYVRHESDWTGGGGDKLSRATSFADESSWAQAMIAHVWSGGDSTTWDLLAIDPASGTDEEGNLQTTKYNDFDNLRWLGSRRGETPIFDADHVGRWYCVEARVRWNDAGLSNGVFELWIDGSPEAARTDLNWVGDYDDYGMNAVFLENHWNAGSPKTQERYFDNFVVSTERIGC